MSEELLTIEWEPISPGSFNPEFTGYTAAPYCTGNPELGWCLYSRGAGACWNQRTKEQTAPRDGLAPQQIGGKWFWMEPHEIDPEFGFVADPDFGRADVEPPFYQPPKTTMVYCPLCMCHWKAPAREDFWNARVEPCPKHQEEVEEGHKATIDAHQDAQGQY